MNPAADAGPVLRDIHLPPAVGWWPPAPGWWLLALLLLIVLGWCARQVHRGWQRRHFRRAVMRELEGNIAAARGNPVELATALSQFLRRVSRRIDAAAGALAGESWLRHLDRIAGSDDFSRGVGRVLIEAPFRPAMAYDTPALIALVRRWTRQVLASGAIHA